MKKGNPRKATGMDGREIAPVRDASCRASSCRATSRSSPQIRARKVLMLERSRKRTAIRQMAAIRVEMAIARNVLAELLSDPAFVALLRAEGLATMSRLLRDHLKDHLEGRAP
jgi:hypothetical protein